MVIFGAGASYDSCSTYPPGVHLQTGAVQDKFHRPPLANELFDNRPNFNRVLEFFPQCKPVVPRLRAPALFKDQTPIEVVLQEIETQSTTDTLARVELLAVRCYLQVTITESGNNWITNTGGITNQLALLRAILQTNKEPVCLVTFNYDLLLEHALSELHHPIGDLNDYTRGFFKLFKLHGSVDWGRELSVPVPQNVNRGSGISILQFLIQNGSEPKQSDPFVNVTPPTWVHSTPTVYPPQSPLQRPTQTTFPCFPQSPSQ